jgi:hypothetical protein
MTDTTKITQSTDFRSKYASVCKYRSTQWDLGLIFGEIQAVETANESGIVELNTGITLGWPAAKALALYLALNILAFESEHGVVKIPPITLQPDISHLAAVPIADLIAEASLIRAPKLIEPPPSATARPN